MIDEAAAVIRGVGDPDAEGFEAFAVGGAFDMPFADLCKRLSPSLFHCESRTIFERDASTKSRFRKILLRRAY